MVIELSPSAPSSSDAVDSGGGQLGACQKDRISLRGGIVSSGGSFLNGENLLRAGSVLKVGAC